MSWFQKYPSTLKAVSEPARVVLEGRILSPNHLASPMGGGKAALYQVIVGVRYRRGHSSAPISSNEQVEVFDRLGSEVFCGSLIIEAKGGVLAVPKEAVFEFPSVEDLAVLPVSSPLPESMAHLSERKETAKGVLSYQELSLSHGDRVRFEGWATPCRLGSAYRSVSALEPELIDAGVTHLAQLEPTKPVVRDLSMDGVGLGRSWPTRMLGRVWRWG